MKTINELFGTDKETRVLTISELITIKGGDDEIPPRGDNDPFKK